MFQESDKCETDYLICIGTSLEVYPFAGLADAVPRHIPRLLINRDRVGSFGNRPKDSILLGDLVKTLKQLADALGWSKDLDQLCKS
jgi:NAD-dependent SIR2 family protein deacetylase